MKSLYYGRESVVHSMDEQIGVYYEGHYASVASIAGEILCVWSDQVESFGITLLKDRHG